MERIVMAAWSGIVGDCMSWDFLYFLITRSSLGVSDFFTFVVQELFLQGRWWRAAALIVLEKCDQWSSGDVEVEQRRSCISAAYFSHCCAEVPLKSMRVLVALFCATCWILRTDLSASVGH